MPHLAAAEERFSLEGDSRLAESSADVCITENLEVGLLHSGPDKGVAFRWSGDRWEAQYSTLRQDAFISWKRPIRGGSLQILQHIPENQWFLLGTPAIKAVHFLKEGSIHDRLEATFDNLNRRSRLSAYSYSGEGRKHKLEWHIDSRQGATVSCRSKANVGPLHSLAASFNAEQGPIVRCKPRPFKALKAQLFANPQTRLLSAYLKLSPATPKRLSSTRGFKGQSAVSLLVQKLLDGKSSPAISLAFEWTR